MSEGLIKEKGAAIPEFFVEPVELTFKSAQEGRPCFQDVEFVRIYIPGDRNSAPVERVNDEHKARWPKHYEAFKAGLEVPLDGTPLMQWPPIKRSQVQELAHFHVRTVEELAAVDDNRLQNLGMGMRELRAQAKLFLEVAEKGTGPLAKMAQRMDALEADNANLKRLLEEATAQLKDAPKHARAHS